MLDQFGSDVAEIVLRFLDLPAAAKASRISKQWHRAHRRRRGTVIGYSSPEWVAARRGQIEPDDAAFGGAAASLAIVDTSAVEWLVVCFPSNFHYHPNDFNDGFLTEFILAWLALQSLPALRSLYVRIPASLGPNGAIKRPVCYFGQEEYYRVSHTLSLICRAGRTPRLTEFGLDVSNDAQGAFRKLWMGLRSRSLSTVKAHFCDREGPVGVTPLANVLSCAAADITFRVSGEMLMRSKSISTLPTIDDATARFALVFDACDSIPNAILSHIMWVNTCVHLDVTVRPTKSWLNARFDWWDHEMESRTPKHRGKLKVLRFHLAGAGVKRKHLQAIVRYAADYYPGLEILEIDVRRNSITDMSLPALGRSHRMRSVCVWLSGSQSPSVPVAHAWLASLHASCAPSVPPSDRSYRVIATEEDGLIDEADEADEDPQTQLWEMRTRMQRDLAVGRCYVGPPTD